MTRWVYRYKRTGNRRVCQIKYMNVVEGKWVLKDHDRPQIVYLCETVASSPRNLVWSLIIVDCNFFWNRIYSVINSHHCSILNKLILATVTQLQSYWSDLNKQIFTLKPLGNNITLNKFSYLYPRTRYRRRKRAWEQYGKQIIEQCVSGEHAGRT